MKLKGKTILRIGAGIGSVIAAAGGLLLAKKTGELSEDKDMTKLSPLGEDEDDDNIIVMEPEDVDEPEEDEEEDE